MRKTIGIFMLAFLAIGTASAQTADQIAKKYVEAIGGAKAWKAVKSRKYTITLAQSGVELTGLILGNEGNKQRLELNYAGMQMIQAFDGTTPWTVNPFQGVTQPTKMEGEQGKQMSETQFLDSFIDYKKRGFSISLEGEETIDGEESYKLKLINKSGSESFHYFSKTTGLKVAESVKVQGQDLLTYYPEYKEVDGLKVPSVIQVKEGIAPYVLTIDKIEYNVEIDQSDFAFPGN